MEKILDNLDSLLASLMLAGCTCSLPSLGIGPLVFIIIAIIRLASKSLGERAKLYDTILTGSILGAIARIVFTYIMIFPMLQMQRGDLPRGIDWLLLTGQALISTLPISAFVAYRLQDHDDATGTAVLGATYIAFGLEGWFHILTNEEMGLLWVFFSGLQLIVAGLGAVLFSFLIERHRHE